MKEHPFISMVMILFRDLFPPVSVSFPEFFVAYFLNLKQSKRQLHPETENFSLRYLTRCLNYSSYTTVQLHCHLNKNTS